MSEVLADGAADPAVHAPALGRAGRVAAVLGGLAGVLYNAWPLGFLLDPQALPGNYISVLEVPARPHEHFFVACDLLAGLTATVVGLLLGRDPRTALGPVRPGLVRAGLVRAGLVLFGVGNMLEASIPIEGGCARSVAACGTGPHAVLAPHDLASIVSIAGLALALWSVRDQVPWMRPLIVVWAASGLFMVASVTLVFWVTVSQAAFLVACGVALGAVPLAALSDRSAAPAPALPGELAA